MPKNTLNGVAIASIAAGSLLIYAGITGKSALGSLYSVVSGNTPSTGTTLYPVSGTSAAPVNPGALQNLAGTGVTPSGAVVPASGSITNSAQAQAYAFSLFGQYGWNAGEQRPLVLLWNREDTGSSWDANAVNPSSGAYGIPQALPSAQGHPFGLGWDHAAEQIQWGLRYIHDRYNSPSNAWLHEQQNGWY